MWPLVQNRLLSANLLSLSPGEATDSSRGSARPGQLDLLRYGPRMTFSTKRQFPCWTSVSCLIRSHLEAFESWTWWEVRPSFSSCRCPKLTERQTRNVSKWAVTTNKKKDISLLCLQDIAGVLMLFAFTRVEASPEHEGAQLRVIKRGPIRDCRLLWNGNVIWILK